jgi:hypothetical protein
MVQGSPSVLWLTGVFMKASHSWLAGGTVEGSTGRSNQDVVLRQGNPI